MARTRLLIASILEALKNPEDVRRPLLEFQNRFMRDLIDTMDFLRHGSSAEPMRIEDIPRSMRELYQSNGQYLLRVYPSVSVWEEESLGRFINAVWTVDREAVGNPVSLYVFASAFRKASIEASIYAIGAIIIILYIPFRSFGLTLLGLLPLAVGTLWTVGIMGIANIQFNLANSIFVPLVFGAGVEYAVVILHRWREGGVQPGHLPFSTGKGVILAALTTTVGFGTLMISHHRGIFSLGFVAWAGSLCILVAAVMLLPAMTALQISRIVQWKMGKGEMQ
jgi:hypothetical protein